LRMKALLLGFLAAVFFLGILNVLLL